MWIQRRCCLKKGSLSASTNWKPIHKGGPPLRGRIDFLSRTQVVYRCPVCARRSPSRGVLLGGEDHNHPWLVPALSLSPILCVCSSDCLLSFLPVEFSKARISCFLWPLGECTVYLMSGTSNKCLCSQCRNNPRQKKTVAMWRIRKKWRREITSQVKEEAVSPTRLTREKREVWGCLDSAQSSVPPATMDGDRAKGGRPLSESLAHPCAFYAGRVLSGLVNAPTLGHGHLVVNI